MIDRKKIKVQEQVDRLVSATNAVSIAEGACLVSVIEAGVEKVLVSASAPASTVKVAGFAILPYNLPTSAVDAEQFTVPASGSLIFSLRYSNVVASSELAQVVGGSALTVDESSFSATPSTGTVKVDLVGGRLKFAAGDAGKVVNFYYQHALSVTQARQKYQERSINNRDLVGDLQQLGVAKGYIEISTDQFDSSKDWSLIGTNLIIVGANGMLTYASSGCAVPGAKVLATPDLSGTAQGAFLTISALIP